MSAPFRLGVLQMPSSRGASWRRALQNASRDQNWVVTKLPGISVGEDPRNIVVLLRDGSQALAMAPELDACVILTEPLTVVCTAMLALYPDNPLKAYAVASERLAAAAVLAARGASVIQAQQASGDFPLLGRVACEQPEDASSGGLAELDPSPLQMYRTGLPIVGETTHWPWNIFTYKTTARSQAKPPKIDLTGRARVVFFGPRFQLPPGEWRIRLRFFLDTEERLSSLRFEWGVNESFEVLDVQLDHSGFYQIELTHRWDMAGAAELRVWAAMGHFVGGMTVEGAEVTMTAV